MYPDIPMARATSSFPVPDLPVINVGILLHVLSPLIVPGLEQQYKNPELFRDWKGWDGHQRTC